MDLEIKNSIALGFLANGSRTEVFAHFELWIMGYIGEVGTIKSFQCQPLMRLECTGFLMH